ncbi:MAG TPA: Rieske 2Fe-2S domain-containing protein [Kofleriaceae bacterium]|nr:Rieske 2Fe-2S domain-containing protein [Kofleriaceae bacterium]
MSVSRRTFLGGTLAAGTVAGSGLLQIGCGNDVEPAPLAPKQTLDADRQFQLDVTRFPDLTPIGGAITIPFNSEAPGVEPQPPVLLVHLADPPDPQPYVVMDSRCPHLGCPLGYSTKDKLVECPCHGSRFDARTGAVRHLPALQPPALYSATLAGTMLTISLKCVPFSTKVLFSAHPQLRDPGGAAVITAPESSCPLVVSRTAAGATALDAHCTHFNCLVELNAGRLECPCHGSRFDLDGAVITGPAVRPLATYVAVVEADGIRITGG